MSEKLLTDMKELKLDIQLATLESKEYRIELKELKEILKTIAFNTFKL